MTGMHRRGPRQPRGARYAAIREGWAAEREAERRRLLCQIESAFDGVRLGNGVSLHQARALDNYESGEEAAAAARTFDTEETWQEIPDEKVDRLGDALSFLDAEGFRFYIPRFMVYTLHHYGASSSFACASAAYFAQYPPDSRHYALLSPDQRQAVIDFGRFFGDQRSD